MGGSRAILDRKLENHKKLKYLFIFQKKNLDRGVGWCLELYPIFLDVWNFFNFARPLRVMNDCVVRVDAGQRWDGSPALKQHCFDVSFLWVLGVIRFNSLDQQVFTQCWFNVGQTSQKHNGQTVS